jgi:hypothetical protein
MWGWSGHGPGQNPIGMKPIDLDTIWDELRLGMDHIYFQNQKPMTRIEYISLYT